MLGWIDRFGQCETEFVDPLTFNAIESHDSIVLWNIDQMIRPSITAEFWWFVTFVGDECQWVDSRPTPVLNLVDELSVRNSPDGSTPSETPNCRCVLFSNTIGQEKLKVVNLSTRPDENFPQLHGRWVDEFIKSLTIRISIEWGLLGHNKCRWRFWEVWAYRSTVKTVTLFR